MHITLVFEPHIWKLENQ